MSYTKTLINEWNLYATNIEGMKVKSIHLGGGTPNYLSPESLDKLFSIILKNTTDDFRGSIEIDPRVCRDEHLSILRKWGFHRVSLGIQDMNLDVQKAINRIQPIKLIEDIVKKIRNYGFDSINFDLIYGLPKQNWDILKHSLSKTVELDIDTIALYSYAHVPWKAKNQNLINEHDLLTGKAKLDLYSNARKFLTDHDLTEIGMDHFCKKESVLDVAKKKNYLTRNFMGYTAAKAPVLIGLGASSISFSGKSFIQNTKDIKNYDTTINSGILSIESGHTMTTRDIETNALIQEIMCKEKWTSNIKIDSKVLKEMQEDHIIMQDNNNFKIGSEGRPFLRNIAMLYDYRLINRNDQNMFSRTI
jgi:oxygen-independent coproporphyrinogen III oxidase